MVEADPNPFPEFYIARPIKAVVEWAGRVMRLGAEVEPCLSNYPKGKGAAVMLDEALEPQLPQEQ